MEGLFHPHQFMFPESLKKENLLKSIVKVRPIRKLEYQFFPTEELAVEFSTTILDDKGFETIRYGLIESDKESINSPEFSEALFTHEFCNLHKNGSDFPVTTNLLGNGNGVLISSDGFIVTNYHLVSGGVEFYKSTNTGYLGAPPQSLKNIEIEVLQEVNSNEYKYKVFHEVSLVASFSKSDAYGNKKDLAILKISGSNFNYLKIAKSKINKFDQIYSIGFSMRTARKEDRLKTIGYENANYDLRISTGLVINEEKNCYLADTDGAPGNSGSAAVNQYGELVGIYSGSTGNGIIDPTKSFRRYVHAELINELINIFR